MEFYRYVTIDSVSLWYPQEDSNLQLGLRRALLYPVKRWGHG